MEDTGFDEMMDENGEIKAEMAEEISNATQPNNDPASTSVMRTLDGQIAGDEFETDARNYQILIEKIDKLLDKLKLDA